MKKTASLALLLLLTACPEGDEWEKFRDEHHCRITQKMDGSTSLTTSGHLVFNDGKVGWQCDDGITYWKDQ